MPPMPAASMLRIMPQNHCSPKEIHLNPPRLRAGGGRLSKLYQTAETSGIPEHLHCRLGIHEFLPVHRLTSSAPGFRVLNFRGWDPIPRISDFHRKLVYNRGTLSDEASNMFVSWIFKGLCSTCSNSTTCTYGREAGRPVTECLEFDGFPMSRPIALGGHLSPLARSWVRPAEESYSGAPGLCGTCNARTACSPEPDKSACTDYR